MKKSYLVLFVLAFVFSYHSQTVRVDYDNSSKWFLGFNVGGTWNSTDVKNRTDAGWGILLGKSYGFKSYSPFTFDIRARYLRGFWYGQDTDTTSLAGYSGSALSGYANQGFTVHNFQSDVHRLGLELAIHLNRITSRSGWDPYIFGGIGLTWHQTFSDLINQNDTLPGAIYNYSSMLPNSTPLSDQIENTLDDVYDSPLDGYNSNTYNLAFMPSLGFGLGYHIGKRVTLGIEHKTTFTLRDDFDGLVSTVQPKNDLYHYTSLFLRFRFRGKQPRENVSNLPCYTPTISIVQPNSGITVTNPQYTIEANLTEVTNSNQISLVNSIGQNVLFNFNSSTKKLTANVLLVPGQNSFTIRVNNRCGSDSKVVSLNFLNCSLPTAVFTNPISIRDTVRSSAFTLTAAISGITVVQGVKLLLNNVVLNGYSFNSTNGLLQASVNLIPGRNTFAIELFNACGNNIITSEVFYNDCVNPTVTLLSPTATGTTVNTSQFILSAIATGVSDRNQVFISHNNIPNNGFTLANGNVSLSTLLNQGINTFTITISTRCGLTSKTFTVDYQTCNAPIITVESPLSNSSVKSANQTVKAKVINVDSKQNLLVSLNGLAVKNINYTKASNSLEFPVNLINGVNSISITATNSCGADVETITILNNPCTEPRIALGAMSSTVNNSAYSFNSTILNQTSNQGINLTLNGNPINYSFSNNLLSTNVNLQNGVNTLILSVTNECGTDTKSWEVTNNNCVTPTIVLESPTASGITVNSSTYNFKASAVGIISSQGIQFLVNDVSTSFNYNNGVISSLLNLSPGANSIKLMTQNSCGNDFEEIVINFQNCEAPGISLNQPINNNFTTNQALLILNANITNVNGNQGITAKLNGIGIPYQFNSNALTASVNLQPGANTILLTAANSCGSDVKAINVNFDNCVQPQITITNSAITSSTSSLDFSATLLGSNLNQGISFSHNGIVKSYTLNGSTISSTVTLLEGENIFILSAVNSCGNASKTYSINYDPCVAPTVFITNPVNNNLTFNTGGFTFQSQVSHVTAANQISIIHNGVAVNNFSFINDQIVSSINLLAGNNTVKITVTSSCGTDSKTITVIGKSCDSPTVTINSSSNSTSNSYYSLQALVANIPTAQGIILSLNGTTQSNFTYSNGNLSAVFNLIKGLNTIVVSVNNECGSASKTISINYQTPEEEKITICHIPPGNPNNPQTIEIPASAWAAHQAHGDVLGTCVPVEEEKITICHIPPGNPNNPQTIEIPASAWAAHQAHGDVLGTCIPVEEEKITICHIPPGNPNNPQTIEIPASAWAAHQAHGDVLGTCQPNNGGNGTGLNNQDNPREQTSGTQGGSNSNNTGGASNGGNLNNTNGTSENSNNNDNSTNSNGNPNENGSNLNSGGTNVNGTSETSNGGGQNNDNGNNGHGNNLDGVDSSNPGQGGGGPNGVSDPSGDFDDESNGSGAINSNSNSNGSTGNQNGTNSNSVGTDPNLNGTGGTNNGDNQNSNGNNNSGNGNTNGNNGHGNNADGVDSSNPGQGGGGPNGVNDPSGNVDDESSGSGSINSNLNSNGVSGNNNQNGNSGSENSTNENGQNSNFGSSNTNNSSSEEVGNSGNSNQNNTNENSSNQGGPGGGNNSGGTGNGNQKNQQINNSGNTRGGSKPTVNQNNSSGKKPSVNQNNSGGGKSTVNQNNSGGKKPSVDQNNSSGSKHSGNKTNTNTPDKSGSKKVETPTPTINSEGTKETKKGGN